MENKDLISDIRERIEEREKLGKGTYFVWVKGHANDPGNVAADKLAVAGAMMGRGVTPEVEAEEEAERAEWDGRGMVGDPGLDEDSEVEEAFKAMQNAMG